MKKLFCLIICLTLFPQIQAQDNMNTLFLGNLSYQQDLSDVWGYEKDGSEYALVGVFNGISVVDVTQPSAPVELNFFPGDGSTWRDLKTWGDYLYCINETGGGLQIVNLSEVIAGSPNPTYIENMQLGFSTAHNIYIDEAGVLYVFGSNYSNGGCEMYDLTQDPENPIFLGVFDDYYLHDGMVRGDTLWCGAIYNGVFSVVDVSDKANPVIMASHVTPNNFSHNCWISDDGDYLFTTDEVSGAYVAAYDVSDLQNIEETDRIQAWSGYTDVIPHNTHVDGDFVVTSYYADGLSVVDVSNPTNMIEVAYYDTSEDFQGDGFNGAWGAYPWLPSGNILVTDIETGLYIIEPKYGNASFIEGEVADLNTGALLSNVMVEIVGSNNSDITTLAGFYQTGVANPGVYQIVFSAPGYSDLEMDVNLSSGSTLSLDVQLEPFGSYQSQISVIKEVTQIGIPAANVLLVSDEIEYNLISDENGQIYSSLLAGSYDVSVSHWGYQSYCGSLVVTESGLAETIELSVGYYDDFSSDLGWVVENDNSVSAGQWERVVPIASYFQNQMLNVGYDVDGDCFEYAFVTSNSENLPYNQGDVDDGFTSIKSPIMDLSSYQNPRFNFSTWFVNIGGEGPADDAIIVSLSNENETLVIFERTISSSMNWMNHSVSIDSTMELTDQMFLTVETMDLPDSGHLVEAGFDNFSVSADNLSIDVVSDVSMNIYPNPSPNGYMNIFVSEPSHCTLINLLGATVAEFKVIRGVNTIDLSYLDPGSYLLNTTNNSAGKPFVWIKQ